MAAALQDQSALQDCASLSFEERLGLLVDRESTLRQNKQLRLRLARAHLRQNACLEDIDFRAARGLDKSQVLSMSSCDFPPPPRELPADGRDGHWEELPGLRAGPESVSGGL